MSITLNPREVLQTLNGMGYRNISAEQLKEFMRDLKRFIIYENRYSNVEEVFQQVLHTQKSSSKSERSNAVQHKEPSRAETINQKSTSEHPRQHSDRTTVPPPVLRVRNQQNQTSFTTLAASRDLPSPDHPERPIQQVSRRGFIPIPPTINVDPEPQQPPPKDCAPQRSTATPTTSATRSKAPPVVVRNTPTDLFHFYQKDWQRFRQLMPGENSRSSVRAAVRKRMEVQPPAKPKVYLRFEEDQTKTTLTRRLGHREM